MHQGDLFRQFMSKSPVNLAMLDTGMNYLLASERWIQEMASGEGNLVGRNHYDVIKNQPAHWREAYERALTGHSEKFEQDIFYPPRRQAGLDTMGSFPLVQSFQHHRRGNHFRGNDYPAQKKLTKSATGL